MLVHTNGKEALYTQTHIHTQERTPRSLAPINFRQLWPSTRGSWQLLAAADSSCQLKLMTKNPLRLSICSHKNINIPIGCATNIEKQLSKNDLKKLLKKTCCVVGKLLVMSENSNQSHENKRITNIDFSATSRGHVWKVIVSTAVVKQIRKFMFFEIKVQHGKHIKH